MVNSFYYCLFGVLLQARVKCHIVCLVDENMNGSVQVVQWKNLHIQVTFRNQSFDSVLIKLIWVEFSGTSSIVVHILAPFC